MIDLVAGALRNATKAVVFSHTSPDGDAIGSLVAMERLLAAMEGVESVVWCLDPVPDIYADLPGVDRFARTVEPSHLEGADLAVALDIAVEDRVNDEVRAAVLDAKLPVVNIDHHMSNSRFGRVNWVQPRKAATAVMLYELFLHMGLPVDREAATAIYLGLMTDTGHFSFHRTGAETFDLAAALVRLGVDPASLKERIYFSQPERKVKLLARAFDRLETDPSARIGWIWSSADDWDELGVSTPDFEGIPDLVNIMRGIDLLMFFREVPGHPVKINFRSKGQVDASGLAEHFGGGGHLNAAGARFDGSLEEAIAAVVETAREYMAGVAAAAAG